MFELRIPVCTEEFPENIDKSLRENLLGFTLLDGEWIETKWVCFIGRIEDDDIIFSRLGDVHHYLIDEVAVRIYDRDSLPILEVIDHL